MQNKFLEIDHISKTFPGVKALSDVYFEIYPGEVHALVGENGAGKSTLIKILAGVYQPDEGGEIVIKGERAQLHSVMDAIRKGISVIYQDFSLFGNLTVAENIAINGMIERKKPTLNWKEIKKIAVEALHVVGISINPNEIVENLSMAKRQMVAIASAIAQNARMIIMDEPTSALSKSEVETLYGIIDKLKAKKIAIMFVSHKMDELFQVGDRFTILRDGQYVRTCKKEEINRDELITLMVGRKVDIANYANPNISPEIVLEVEDLSKHGNYKNISFQLHKGEILGITGLVGAGRSEMVQTIFGLSKADRGTIKINGKKVNIRSTSEAIQLGIGYVPESRQTQGLILEKTVSENITLPLLKKFTTRMGFVDRKAQKSNVADLVEKMDVRPRNPENLAMNLSGGNQQKVVLAKWMAARSKVLIVDEPTNGVDVGAKEEIHKVLHQLAKNGTSLIIISSELPEVLAMSDRILVMRQGEISAEFVNRDISQEMIMDKAVVN